MAGAARQVAVMQVMRLDPVGHHGAEQVGQRRRAVIHAPEQHRLAQHGDAGIHQAADRHHRLRHEFAGVVGMQQQPHGLVAGFQRRDQIVADTPGVDDRHAAVDADHAQMRDGIQPFDHLFQPARRDDQRIAAGEDHLPDRRMPRDIVDGGIELVRAQAFRTRPYHLAAETETAIDRADIHQLEQHAVGVAVHDAGHRAVRLVANRIAALMLMRHQFRHIGQELARDRVFRIAGVDLRLQVRRDGNGKLRGHFFKCRDAAVPIPLLGAHAIT